MIMLKNKLNEVHEVSDTISERSDDQALKDAEYRILQIINTVVSLIEYRLTFEICNLPDCVNQCINTLKTLHNEIRIILSEN